MMRGHRIDIFIEIDKDFDAFCEEDRQTVKKKILPYLFFPRLSVDDPNQEAQQNDIQGIVASYDNYRCGKSFMALEKGNKRTTVRCSFHRDFCDSYLREEFRNEVLAHIERLQAAMPFKFAVELELHRLDHNPEMTIVEGTFFE